jgi:hypothetical protein
MGLFSRTKTQKAIAKMELLKFDALYDLIKGQYPPFSRPAVAQAIKELRLNDL